MAVCPQRRESRVCRCQLASKIPLTHSVFVTLQSVRISCDLMAKPDVLILRLYGVLVSALMAACFTSKSRCWTGLQSPPASEQLMPYGSRKELASVGTAPGDNTAIISWTEGLLVATAYARVMR